jgi:hypothetical protein
MVTVVIATREWDPARREVKQVDRAKFTIDGRHVEISGDADYIALDIPVVEPETGKQLLFHEDPEAWAANLPYAFRSGDIVVEVVPVAVPVPVPAPAPAPAARR